MPLPAYLLEDCEVPRLATEDWVWADVARLARRRLEALQACNCRLSKARALQTGEQAPSCGQKKARNQAGVGNRQGAVS